MQTKGNADGVINRDNYYVWASVIFLLAIGLLFAFSITAVDALSDEKCGYNPMFYLKNQLLFMILGLAVMFLAQYFNYEMLYYLTVPAYILGIILILLLRSPLGVESNGARRWLEISGVQFQVCELVKIAVILGLAYVAKKYAHVMCSNRIKNKLKVVFIMWAVGMVPAVLLIKISNDLSSSLIIIGITFFVSFICSKAVYLHLGFAGAGISGIAAFIFYLKQHLPDPSDLEDMSFRIGRIAAWLAPERYRSEGGFQILQALYAVGRGRLIGTGLGSSIQKNYIPEAENDMIFSIICEETGLFGACIVLLLFGYLTYLLVRIAFRSESLYGAVIVVGVMLHISLQVITHVAVNVNLFPNTGLALPLISKGGTALVTQMLELGLVLSVERRSFIIKFKRKLRKISREGNES